jgi:ATP-dependent DNA helicase RecG
LDLGKLQIGKIKGIGKIKEDKLKQLGIFTVEDLLTNYPRSYIDRTRVKRVGELLSGDEVCFRATVNDNVREIKTKGGLKIYETNVSDISGTIKIRWFNQSYVRFKIKRGMTFLFFGRVETGKIKAVINPSFEELYEDSSSYMGILPIYSLVNGLSQNTIRQVTRNACEEYLKYMKSNIPKDIRQRLNLMDFDEAIRNVHFADNMKFIEDAKDTLIFEELFNLQVQLLNIKDNINVIHKERTYMNMISEVEGFITSLKFQLTAAQKNVVREILEDMDSAKVLNRLVQGDVGSGKTVVAAIAIFKGVKSGYQCAMMAPTEVLAKQHFEELTNLYSGYGIKVCLLTGSMTKKEKTLAKEALKNGEVDVAVGTHALIQSDVEFKKLALVITDEQHRFGVRQRGAISGKGKDADVLIMSATPIPRTLALIIYGDMDVSLIDEMPKGRTPVETFVIKEHKRDGLNKFIKENIEDGGQAFFVCPLIEDSEKLESLVSAKSLWEEYSKDYFKDYMVGLLHGKMSEDDKDKIIGDFASGNIHILVSTTVIEVGVNIPNANIMVVENAERFGLSQLHQLRGRVGRGIRKSYCFLFNQVESQSAASRLNILRETNDGFKISEKDLEIRGPGEFFGYRQSGLPFLKLANLCTDIKVLKEIQEICLELKREGRLEEISKNINLLKMAPIM